MNENTNNLTFSYDAKTADGEMVKGEIESHSVADAIEQLRQSGLEVHAISQLIKPVTTTSLSADRLTQTLTDNDWLLPKLDAFAAEIPPSRWRNRLQRLIQEIRAGASSEDLTDKFPDLAPLLIGSLAHVGSGNDDPELHESRQSINTLLDDLQRHQQRHSHWFKRLLYPFFLLALAFGVLCLLCWQVIPEFSQMFKEFGFALPPTTRLLMNVSDYLVQNTFAFFAWVALAAAAMAGCIWLFCSERFGERVIGRVSKHARSQGLAGLLANVADLAEGGLPTDHALRIASQRCSPRLRTVAESMVRNVVMKTEPESGLLPPNALYALGFRFGDEPGETSATLAQPNIGLLRELSQLYRDRTVDHDYQWHELISAFAIIAVGLVVGFVVLSLFAPLISLVSGLS